jgi:amino acid transporter
MPQLINRKVHMARPNLSLHQSRFSPSPVWLFYRPFPRYPHAQEHLGLIILGLILDLGGGPDHDRLGFRYWKHPGPFAQYDGIAGAKGRFLGFWAVMSQAAFSFIGTEIVAVSPSFRLACRTRIDVIKMYFQIAAGEAKNPRRNLPKAIRRVYIRILLFYIGGVTIIGLLVPSTDPGLKLGSGTAAASPFVIAIKRSGIKFLPGVFLSHSLLQNGFD